jgi:hypothetical protein
MEAVENNVILNAFRMSMLTSTTHNKNQDNEMDEFRDEGVLDTATSTGKNSIVVGIFMKRLFRWFSQLLVEQLLHPAVIQFILYK